MRVNELSKQIGKSNKEVLEILQKNHFDVKSHSSKVTEEQAEAVRRFLAGAKRQTTASKTDTGKAETNRVEDIKKEPLEAEKKEAEKTTEPPKKRIAAVYRPQNSVQRGNRPAGKGNAGNAAKTGAPASRPAAASAEQTAEPAKSAAPAENRDGQRSGYQGNRDGQRSGGYQGNRDGQRSGGYQGNRDGQRSGGYQGNRDGQRSGGYQGNRDGQRSGYQGNRDGQRSGGYQGNRDGQRSGGYQGNRDGQRSGGYQGNRDGQRSGGYQGNRDGQRSGGYQGNRDGQRSGGYQGNRDGQRSGGYQGGRDGQRGGRDGRGGLNIPKPSFDSPVVQKPQNNKQNKNNYKNDKYSKIDHEEEMHSKGRGGKNVKSAVQPPQKKEAKVEEIKTITIPEVITIKDLADKMKLQPSVIVKKLFLQGKVVTINQEVDYEQAEEIAMEFDVLCEKEVKVDVIEELLKEEEEDEKDMVTRPPVVCVMGHVDHGKTSLLDAIRQTNVTAKEAGGITQHIGAYRVQVDGKPITFLDTPGHAAFTSMPARGAQVTDIAILVVAADDGIMPQTIEAINHAKAANVPIIVAVNKIDKEGANPDRVLQQLTEYELVPEEWGGDTIVCNISAKYGQGIENLLEMVLLTAEVSDLKANPDRQAKGTVIEAKLDKGRGPVATVLVQNGTLHAGDVVVAGTAVGRVRAMTDDDGKKIQTAGPSVPVEIIGLGEVPGAGDIFYAVDDERMARELVEQRKQKEKDERNKQFHKVTLDNLFASIQEGEMKELSIIVKADVQGSVEALRASLEKLSNEEVRVRVIHGAVGAINESDVMLAAASGAIIVGFNVRPDRVATDSAAAQGVDMRMYRIIYDCIEEMEQAMKGMLAPKFREAVLGHAEVRTTFRVSGVGTIAGCYVQDGKIQRAAQVRIVRDGIVIHEGVLSSLKRFKDDVKEVASGYECGCGFENFNDIKEGDVFEAFVMEEIKQ